MKKVTKIILKKGIKLAARQAGKSAKDFAVNTAKEAALVYIHAATDQDLAGRPFRKIKRRDRDAVLGMMKDFYSSAAVLSNGSEEIFNKDIDACISENPYLEGFVFVQKCSAEAAEADNTGDDVKDEAAPETEAVKEKILGYAMIAHSFSTEYGMPCIWIEDLYLIKVTISCVWNQRMRTSALWKCINAMASAECRTLKCTENSVILVNLWPEDILTTLPQEYVKRNS